MDDEFAVECVVVLGPLFDPVQHLVHHVSDVLARGVVLHQGKRSRHSRRSASAARPTVSI